MAYTENQIKQLALNELGFNEDLDFTSTTDEAVLKVNASYDLIKEHTMQRYKWAWATTTVKLETPTELTDHKYKYKFTLPTDLLRYVTAYRNFTRDTPIIDFEIYNGEIYVSNVNKDEEIWVTYVQDANVSVYPSYFVEYFKLKLAFDLCFDITGDTQLLEILNKREQFEWRNAINIDQQQKRSKVIRSMPYIQVRG